VVYPSTPDKTYHCARVLLETFVGANNTGPALGSGEVSGKAGICDGSSICSAIGNYTRKLSCNTP